MSNAQPPRKRYLVLCTGNHCRSQITQGWITQIGKHRVEVCSAGTDPKPIHPLAIQVMKEVGINIIHQGSDHVDQHINDPFDCVLTVSDTARAACPVFPGATRILHHEFENPVKPHDPGEDPLKTFRRVRDQIGNWVQGFLAAEFAGREIGRLNPQRQKV